MKPIEFNSVIIKLASPEVILSWSHGEVTEPETIDYRTQKPKKDGLFCEKIFGPEKDYRCSCGKYKGVRYKGIVCDRCGVEVTTSSVRRERMGHIKLASPASHIWFLRGIPSVMGMIVGVPRRQLEEVIYFSSYIITGVDQTAKKEALSQIEKEYKTKLKKQIQESKTREGQAKAERELLKAKEIAEKEVSDLKPLAVLSEIEYRDLSLKYGEIFEAGTGAETLRQIFGKLNLPKIILDLKKDAQQAALGDRKKILKRLKLIQGMQKAGVHPEWMFLTVLPVLPAGLRPMVRLEGGRYAASDVNDLYRRVINRNSRLKYLLEINAPEVIVRNEKRMLQEAVDALIDNQMRRKQTTTRATTGGTRVLQSLADRLRGKQGRFRRNLLGKRVDYSGRSVIVVGPELKLFQCGLPKTMALELFKPFVISGILKKELAYNVRQANELIEKGIDEVWAILEEVVKGKLVYLNRAPTLHRLGIQAFHPVLVEGESIRIPPVVCKAYNADFDGDQMGVYLPLSDRAQEEAKHIILSSLSLLKPATGNPVVIPTQDIILGCYFLTRVKEGEKGEGSVFSSKEEALLAYELGKIGLRAEVKVLIGSASSEGPKLKSMPSSVSSKNEGKGASNVVFSGNGSAGFIRTSVGRIIFNEALGPDFPFQNCKMDSAKLAKVVSQLVNNYKLEQAGKILDQIKDLGFEYSTRSGVTWGMDDLIVPSEKKKIIEESEKEVENINKYFEQGFLSEGEKTKKIIELWHKAKLKIEELIPKALSPFESVFSIIDSGARGSWTQIIQMSGMKGLVINPAGRTIEIPIKSSFKEGFDVLEYFISCHGARKGTVDTALRTSKAGYLTRRLADVAHGVIVSEADCHDKEGITVSRKDADDLGQRFNLKIVGRVALEDIKMPLASPSGTSPRFRTIVKKGEIIDWDKANAIIQANIHEVKVRSPLSCRVRRGVCQMCYGWDMGKNKLVEKGQAVGIVAAQSIGEPGTQLTMRTFHAGGVAGGKDITLGLPRVEEIFEARSPKGEAIISEIEGVVEDMIHKPEMEIIKIVGPIKEQRDVKKSKKSRKGTLKKKAEKQFRIYKIPTDRAVWVKKGQKIEAGQQLCEGSVDLNKLFKVSGVVPTQQYIAREVQKVYASQGAPIHDKHLEVIIRQMFSRVMIKDVGDSRFRPGEIVERAEFIEENELLKKQKKEMATARDVLLGISKVALSSESFLSAASFQRTSEVLIRAALEGKEDKLRGLKENVILGKLIPVGTGFRT